MKAPQCPTCGTPLAWDRKRDTYGHCHDDQASRTLVRRANRQHRQETHARAEKRGQAMSTITTTTSTTTTEHTTALAGGIRATLAPAVFGATLTLIDGEPRVLVLPILPDALAEIATEHGAYRFWAGVDWFLESARERLPDVGAYVCGLGDDDYAALRALAVALLAGEAGQ